MSIIKKSAIALAVASCFSVVGVAASEQDSIEFSIADAQQVVQKKSLTQIAKVHTNIGLKNQVDTQIGQATFQWTSGPLAKINIKPIRQESRIAYAAQVHLNHLTLNPTAFGSKVFISNSHNQNGGAKLAKYKQEISGIEVFNREVNIMMDRDYNLVASSGFFANNTTLQALNVKKQPLAQFGEPSKAISHAFKDMGGNIGLVSINEQSSDKKYTLFNATNSSGDFQLVGEPRAKKVFFELNDELISAHYVEIETADPNTVESEYHAYVIAADSGKVLFKKNMRSHAGDFHYRVHADTEGMNKPEQGPFGEVVPLTSDVRDFVSTRVNASLVSLTSGPISTKDAWLAEGATKTSGNNVKSYVDAVAPNGFTSGDYYADTTSDNTFDYMYNQNENEYSINNRKAAIVNLFYVNNYLHDQFYNHGFDELSGNAQDSNYDRGGVEGDPLLVEVQDNSGFNNANMVTPADGASPVMQMYLFDDKDAVNGQDYGITSISGSDFEFNTPIVWNFGSERFDVQGTLTAYLDEATGGFGNTCESITNPENLLGNIAVVQYSFDCPTSEQFGNLKNAGAIGSIVVVPFGGDRVFNGIGLQDDDPAKSALSFPVMNISQNESSDLFANWKNDIEVRFFDERQFRDSSWDNGIVAHEWGHYISNRLVGNGSGLRNHQGRSLGEGWGDFHALMLLANEKDAQIAGNDTYQLPYEISSYTKLFRKVPYTPNMTLNGLTFKDIQRADGTAQVHDAGTLWATTLWDAYVRLINEHTFKEAESRMMDYLVAGYKMTPINPTYTEARDAILAAAAASDQNDFKIMLKAFARRGMGLDAVSPARFSEDHSGVVESFEADTNPVSLKVMSHNLNTNYEGLTSGYCSNDNILDAGETGTVSFKVMNTNPEKPLTNIKAKIEVLSNHDVTFENDGIITFDTLDAYVQVATPTLEFKLNDVKKTRDLLSLKLSFIDLDEETKASLTDASEIHELVNYSFGEQEATNNSAVGRILPYDFTIKALVGGEKVENSTIFILGLQLSHLGKI
ncbi:M36 family metallopeptidase [Pseudoalteromonas sp. NBT06-2]|uniref:M36 family metallopeptidase n=1 Tax=Pseudoalteromonas sp. NBT06-2 TaxID=2025950 RepID=UPI0014839EA6|nr:M36 family metallopeptidase [Pseudoalteromonas sp. NBT06-2]